MLRLFFSLPAESISKHISKDYEFAKHATLQKPDQQMQYAISLVTWQKKEASIWYHATKWPDSSTCTGGKNDWASGNMAAFPHCRCAAADVGCTFQAWSGLPGPCLLGCLISCSLLWREHPWKSKHSGIDPIAQTPGKERPGVCTQMAAFATTKECGWRRQVCIFWQSLCLVSQKILTCIWKTTSLILQKTWICKGLSLHCSQTLCFQLKIRKK